MIVSRQIDELSVYVAALPLDDVVIFQMLAGLNGEKLVERDDMKEALGFSAVATNKRVDRAFRRLRMAMGLPPEIEDDEIVEALIVSEVRRRAAATLAAIQAACEDPVAKPEPDGEWHFAVPRDGLRVGAIIGNGDKEPDPVHAASDVAPLEETKELVIDPPVKDAGQPEVFAKLFKDEDAPVGPFPKIDLAAMRAETEKADAVAPSNRSALAEMRARAELAEIADVTAKGKPGRKAPQAQTEESP